MVDGEWRKRLLRLARARVIKKETIPFLIHPLRETVEKERVKGEGGFPRLNEGLRTRRLGPGSVAILTAVCLFRKVGMSVVHGI